MNVAIEAYMMNKVDPCYIHVLCVAYVQGQKLSRYSRQAKELRENGGPGLGEDDLNMLGVAHSKRPRLQGMDGTMVEEMAY